MTQTLVQGYFEAMFSSSAKHFTAQDIYNSMKRTGFKVTEDEVEEAVKEFIGKGGWLYTRLWTAGKLREHYWTKIGEEVGETTPPTTEQTTVSMVDDTMVFTKGSNHISLCIQEVEELKEFIAQLWYCEGCKRWIRNGDVCPNCGVTDENG